MKLLSHYKESISAKGPQIINWRENNLNKSLYYSYRATHYSRNTFPSRLHYHDYFELVIFEEGDIHYICESASYQPKSGDVLLIPPGMFHMSMIRCDETLYKRHVFYLYPDALDDFNCGVLTDFLRITYDGLTVFSIEKLQKDELLALLQKLNKALDNKSDPSYEALSIGFVIQIFFLLSKSNFYSSNHSAPLPETVYTIKKYIDDNFRELSSTNEIAAHFFYSREYVSRLFRKYFNTTVSEYIKARRISYSQTLIEQGYSISEACYQSGFENMSTFIRSFHNISGMTPSEYRKALKKKA